jgi:hypothetical protein
MKDFHRNSFRKGWGSWILGLGIAAFVLGLLLVGIDQKRANATGVYSPPTKMGPNDDMDGPCPDSDSKSDSKSESKAEVKAPAVRAVPPTVEEPKVDESKPIVPSASDPGAVAPAAADEQAAPAPKKPAPKKKKKKKATPPPTGDDQ